MKRLRFTEEHIIGFLREQEAGGLVADLCRKHGLSRRPPTLEGQVRRPGRIGARRLKALEDENAKLKRMLADAMLDNVALKICWKKVVTPAAHREASAYLQSAYEMSERRECKVLGVDRSSVRCAATPDDGVLRDRLKALAQERRRFGYRRLHVLLRREGHTVNKKRVQWLIARRSWCAGAADASERSARGRPWRSRWRPTSAGAWTSFPTR